jgi:tRNA (guanine37-N1)-methyltransferase
MKVSILTVFPELYTTFLTTSLFKKAQDTKLVTCDVTSFFSFVKPKERIDAPTFGPGSGMLIKPEVMQKAIEAQEAKFGKAFKIFFSPQGKKLDQEVVKELAEKAYASQHVMLVASRYEGIDERVEAEYADAVISIGDYVLMGGDLPAQVTLEGIARFWPGIVGKQESVEEDSFSGPFLDYPEYTEPLEWHGKKVPDIVRSGNHGAIKKWRSGQAARKSVLTHFDWLRSFDLDQEEKELAGKYIPPHYVALLHDEVLLPKGKVGTSSVTSLDIHDIGRSATTYGLKNYFIVTPLADQTRIVNTLIDFWRSDSGIAYNPDRHQMIEMVQTKPSLDAVIVAIEEETGKKPLLIATSAKSEAGKPLLSYWQQDEVWQHDRPVMFLLGTARGLAPIVINRADYLIGPIEGFSDYNHLSVRSAAAIILDRWLGINPKHYKK